ncbi:MAG TPA: metal-dependent transcriptional regulator [Chitinophagaceae bacterium]|nr:metal-dependent transcriptional regulator [Chitinophagaceae bacterium]
MHSFTEENYLKTIYKLQEQNGETVVNSDLAKALEVQSASVTDMLKKMARKKLINYEKSKGFRLTEKGKHIALGIIRKHRLWEVFLLEKLGFGWNEVHEMAEQLEHIQSEKLIDRLDNYLGHPKSDPHGDPIPNANGVFIKSKSILLSETQKGTQGKFVGVTDHSPSFLTYLDKIGLSLGDPISVKLIEDFDNSFTLQLKGKKEVIVSFKVANSLLVSH